MTPVKPSRPRSAAASSSPRKCGYCEPRASASRGTLRFPRSASFFFPRDRSLEFLQQFAIFLELRRGFTERSLLEHDAQAHKSPNRPSQIKRRKRRGGVQAVLLWREINNR